MALSKTITSKTFQLSASLAIIALGVVAGLLVYRHAKAPRPVGDPLIAVVNETLIHKSDLSVLSPVPAQEATGLLVDFTLLDQEARKKNVTVSDAEMQQERLQVTGNQGGKTYADAAKALGRTPAGLDLQLRHAALLYKLAAMKFKSPIGRMIHARAILIRTDGAEAKSDAKARTLAGRLQQQVAGGADIAALARANSNDSESAPNGGDLGIIQLAGAPNLVRFAPDFKLQKALAGAVRTAMSDTVMNGPIHGDLGYWVVKIVSTSDKQLGDAARYQQVQTMWQQMWVGRLEPQVMASLRGSAQIQPPIAVEPQQPGPRQPVATVPPPADPIPATHTL